MLDCSSLVEFVSGFALMPFFYIFFLLHQFFLNYFMCRFRAMLYPCPESQSERREMALGVMTRIEDFKAVREQFLSHLYGCAHSVCGDA